MSDNIDAYFTEEETKAREERERQQEILFQKRQERYNKASKFLSILGIIANWALILIIAYYIIMNGWTGVKNVFFAYVTIYAFWGISALTIGSILAYGCVRAMNPKR